ncbi:ABC-type transport auxiliary lipoprotein family protein [Acidovorax sp. D2M1]|uniref:ABC-type transport auxiliary lipoprotein family protein n=1 Tax=Acidovorax benzenivorans TaxID=2987520 RepID=A0ABT5RQ39_9BURK|nr:ABC-type transport auxiliary lipoprotein family protein [Acidovorax benzenivorans]MDD2175817.1 ABC-type transport auxiliary lipoprotein family protein [Acidovorax benzenivorans]
MITIKDIANKAYTSGAILLWGCGLAAALVLTGCSALPAPPARPALYDFGPGPLATAPTDRRASLPPLAMADMDAPGLPEGGNAVLYRLAYADAQQLRPYSQARWSQPPAQLLQQRLREQLGQRRAVLKADDGAAQARESAQGNKLPLVLRTELEEFSHLFTSPSDSAGVVRLRATVVELTPAGESLRGQRVFIVQQPARSADAAGGVAALAAASGQLASELAAWVEQVGQ